MVDKAKMKKVMKSFTPKRTAIAQTGSEPLEFPNHSRGKAPESDKGLVNKSYVDDNTYWTRIPGINASLSPKTAGDDLLLESVSIKADVLTSSTGQFDFDNDNIVTNGYVDANGMNISTVGGTGIITSDTGFISFDDENISTTGIADFGSLVTPYENTIIVAKSGGDYTTVTAAIAAAVSGDTILIYPGTYAETGMVPAAGVNVVGIDRESTIISTASAAYSGIFRLASAGTYSFENLTIIDTSDVNVVDFGSGIRVFVGNITLNINNCHVEGGQDSIYFNTNVSGQNVTIRNSYIEGDFDAIGFWSDDSIFEAYDTTFKTTGIRTTSGTGLRAIGLGNTATDQVMYLKNCRLIARTDNSDAITLAGLSFYSTGSAVVTMIDCDVDAVGSAGKPHVRGISTNSGGTINISGCKIRASGGATSNYDIQIITGGVINATGLNDWNTIDDSQSPLVTTIAIMDGNVAIGTPAAGLETYPPLSDLTIKKAPGAGKKVGISISNNTINEDTYLDFLEGNTGDGLFGTLNNFGFRLTYDGGLNDFFLKSGNSGTVKTVFRIDRDAIDLWLPNDNQEIQLGATTTDFKLYSDGTNGVIDVATALRVGNNVTNYSEFSSTGDQVFVGSAGLPYGSFYGNEFNQSQAMTTNTEYQVAHASIADATAAHNITSDGNGKFTITKAGRYNIQWAITADHSTTGKHVFWGVAVDQLLRNEGQQHRETVATNKKYNISGNTIINMAVGEDIEIGFKSADGTPGTALISHMNLTVVQVGG